MMIKINRNFIRIISKILNSYKIIFYQKTRTDVKISRSLNIKLVCIYICYGYGTRKPIACRFRSAINV